MRTKDELWQVLLATTRMPWVGGAPVPIDGRRYIDGALTCPIPVANAVAAGATHVLVLQTRPYGVPRSAGGRVASVRTVPDGDAGALELRAALAEIALADAGAAAPSYAPSDADELLVVSGFVRRPGPELRIVPLGAGGDDLVAQSHDVARILAA